ncbi:hypothetical protein EMCG_01469 [[Emmonsia] crescens]|uniref:Uncharacterized protein n=1 Tax=[Emmonsia] crescens TaxID=73230 RepID=A0A0G2J9M0_9EURO|nr:hypothetical protein EMCG_01469 [Emmonsia crescens UAMH 3008]
MTLGEEDRMEVEENSTREARRVSETENPTKQKRKLNNLATAIQALTAILREGESDKEINEKGRECLQNALRAVKEMKAELCDQLLEGMERAMSAFKQQNLHNKPNGTPTWAAIAARGEPPAKAVPTKTLREIVITRRSCEAIPEAERTSEAIVTRANEAIKDITKRKGDSSKAHAKWGSDPNDRHTRHQGRTDGGQQLDAQMGREGAHEARNVRGTSQERPLGGCQLGNP